MVVAEVIASHFRHLLGTLDETVEVSDSPATVIVKMRVTFTDLLLKVGESEILTIEVRYVSPRVALRFSVSTGPFDLLAIVKAVSGLLSLF